MLGLVRARASDRERERRAAVVVCCVLTTKSNLMLRKIMAECLARWSGDRERERERGERVRSPFVHLTIIIIIIHARIMK